MVAIQSQRIAVKCIPMEWVVSVSGRPVRVLTEWADVCEAEDEIDAALAAGKPCPFELTSRLATDDDAASATVAATDKPNALPEEVFTKLAAKISDDNTVFIDTSHAGLDQVLYPTFSDGLVIIFAGKELAAKEAAAAERPAVTIYGQCADAYYSSSGDPASDEPVVDETPIYMGVPADFLKELPKTARQVFDSNKLLAVVCKYCFTGQNVDRDLDGKLIGVFCNSCTIGLAHQSEYLCKCGQPRFLDPLARPSGPVCSACHKQGKANMDKACMAKKSRGVGRSSGRALRALA